MNDKMKDEKPLEGSEYDKTLFVEIDYMVLFKIQTVYTIILFNLCQSRRICFNLLLLKVNWQIKFLSRNY